MTESKPKSQPKKDVKIFSDLKKEIIDTNYCCACGSCVAYCESQAFNVIEMEGYTPKFKSSETEENCTECGLCYFICPQTNTLLTELNKAHEIEDEVGHIIDIIAAKTTDEAIEKVGQDGGVVSTIISHLFDTHKIDAAIVSEYDKNQNTIPKIIYNKEELLKSAGTRYSISPQILPLKDLYNISQEIIKEKTIFDIEQLRVAIVGTPCQVRAIAKMKYLHVKPAHVIKYVISLFCFENFDYEDLYNIIEKKTKVKPDQIKKTWIKKNFFVLDKKDKTHEIKIKTLDAAVRNHCHKCDEFTGKFSDISVGASGAPQGYSMIVMRTEKGKKLVDETIAQNLIEPYLIPSDQGADWKTRKINWFKKMISFKNK